MKRTIATVLALLMVFALIPVVGEPAAEAANATGIQFTAAPLANRFYLLNEKLNLNGITVGFFEYDASGNPLLPNGADVTGDVTYTLNDKNPARAVTGGEKLSKVGDFTLTATYKVSSTVSYTATLAIRVREEKVAGVTVLKDPYITTYFVGETLDLTGLSYGVNYQSFRSGGAVSRTDTSLPLSAYALQSKDANDDLTPLTVGSLPRLDTVGTFKIVASYTAADQWDRVFTNEAATYEVLAAPTSIALENQAGTALYPPASTVPITVLNFTKSQIGHTETLTATTVLSTGASTNPSYVSWGSSNTNVATVSSEGLLKIVGVGEAIINARTRGNGQLEASFKVQVVNPIALTDVTLNKTEITLTTGAQDKLIATLVPADAAYTSIAWTSSDDTVVSATQNSDKLSAALKAKKAGSATITVTVTAPNALGNPQTYTASCIVNVHDVPVDLVYLTPTAVTLKEGESYQIQGTVLPYDATNSTMTWSSSNETLATVKDGRISIKEIPWASLGFSKAQISAGSCSTTVKIYCVSASNPTARAECTVTIRQGALVTQISLNKYNASVAIGGTSQLSATSLPATATTKTVTWTSSDPTIATVSSTGKVTGIKAGQCIITATSNGSGATDLSAACTVTVSSVGTGSIGLNALNLTMYKGQTSTLVPTIFPSNATNKNVTFSSSNPSVASVNANTGVITAHGNGKTTIVVTADDGSAATASCMVSVIEQINVTRITLNMGDFSLLHKDTTILSATVIPDYASEIEVTWSSSNPTVASVDKNGKVTGLLAGQSATITAKAKDESGVTASVDVSVVSTFYGNGKVVNCLRRVNVRAQASGSSKQKGYAYLNETYKIVGKTGNWYKIMYKGELCYIWSAYIRLIGDGKAEYVSAGAAEATAGTGTSTGTPTTATITNCVYAVNVRSGPGTNYDKIGTAPLNSTYTYLGTYGDWYKVQFTTTAEGYIHSNYVFVS